MNLLIHDLSKRAFLNSIKCGQYPALISFSMTSLILFLEISTHQDRWNFPLFKSAIMGYLKFMSSF